MIDHTISVLIALTKDLRIGTNLALLQFLWMLVSGALLPNQGAIFPALKSIGLSDAATRRAWASFRQGAWQMPVILGCGGPMCAGYLAGSRIATKAISPSR